MTRRSGCTRVSRRSPSACSRAIRYADRSQAGALLPVLLLSALSHAPLRFRRMQGGMGPLQYGGVHASHLFAMRVWYMAGASAGQSARGPYATRTEHGRVVVVAVFPPSRCVYACSLAGGSHGFIVLGSWDQRVRVGVCHIHVRAMICTHTHTHTHTRTTDLNITGRGALYRCGR